MQRGESEIKLDDLDFKILRRVQKNCMTNYEMIAKELKIPTSTLRYRIKKLERSGVIEGYYAKINPLSIGKDYLTIVFVRIKHGRDYDGVGKKLALIPGVWAVYFVLGDMDLIVHLRVKDREDFLRTLDKLLEIEEIERTLTRVIIKVMKEDPRVDI